ncbi:MAG TPA: high-potential iron-sulfur protein [Caulobacteraceae bacterium]|nr:high-potential iron-sulfur protein [Caulobacteraceae bacterium]
MKATFNATPGGERMTTTALKSLQSFDLSRRALLRGAALTGVGAVGALGMAGRASAAGKLPQAAVNYQGMPKGSQKCSNCNQWIQPSACKVVDGSVSPNGWCSLYAQKW